MSAAAPAAPSPADVRCCSGCLDPVPEASDSVFDCPARAPCGTVFCRPCFARYAATCVASPHTVPMRCICGEAVPDGRLRALLADEPDLVASYERACVRHALHEAGEEHITCSCCSRYSAVLPRNYRQQAHALLETVPEEREGEEKEGEGEEEEGEGEQDYVYVHEGGEPDPADADASAEDCDRLTGAIFECPDEECDGSYCLACGVSVEGRAAGSHRCAPADKVRELADAIHEALAEGAMRRCPSCGSPGVKDLSCTHIRCQVATCQTRWCYCCRGVLADMPRHNTPYNVETAEWDGKCPLYLKYAFGDEMREVEGRLDGDPRLALRRFHTSLQVQAVEKLRERLGASVDDALWSACLEREFPHGLFAADDVEFLGRRGNLIATMRARREERARVARREAARRQREAERRRRARMEEHARLTALIAEAHAESQRRITHSRQLREEHRRGLRDFLRERRRARQQVLHIAGN